MKILLIYFISLLLSIFAYNIDITLPTIFHQNLPDSFYGYTVGYLNTRQGLRVLISAPALHNPANMPVYICNPKTRQCHAELIGNVQYDEKSEENGRWLGISMEQISSHEIVICSHLRTRRIDYAPGFCYRLQENPSDSANLLQTELKPLDGCNADEEYFDKNEERYYVKFCSLGQAGFSAHYSQDSKALLLGAVGFKGFEGAMVTFGHDLKTWNKVKYSNGRPVGDIYLGYAVTSGRYFGGNIIYYAIGAPRSNLSGEVFVFDSEMVKFSSIQPNIIAKLGGTEIGEYFGSSLLTVYITPNTDPFLFVGAPLFGGATYEEGRIIIYRRTSRNPPIFGENDQLLGSSKTGARFGSAISNIGDINQDGYKDVAIGAPHEDNGRGTIYIYQGFKTRPFFRISQVIKAKSISGELKTFGISISSGIDFDGNHYPDFLVGSYGNNSAVLLRSRSVVAIQGSLNSTTSKIILNANCLQEKRVCFEIEICFYYLKAVISSNQKHIMYYKLMADRRVLLKDDSQSINTSLQLDSERTCSKYSVYLKSKSMEDFLNPLEFRLSYQLDEAKMIEGRQEYHGFMPTLDILELNMKHTAKLEIPINQICKNGSTCVTDLAINAVLKPNRTYLTTMEINKLINLQVIVLQRLEPALSTRVKFAFNWEVDSVQFKDFENVISCDKDTYTCSLGNMLAHSQVLFSAYLFFKPNNYSDLSIDLMVSSTSTDQHPEDNTKKLVFPIKEAVDISGFGEAVIKDQFCDLKKNQNCTMQHIYKIQNKGEVLLKQALVTVLWPQVISLTNQVLFHFQEQDLPHGCTYVPYNGLMKEKINKNRNNAGSSKIDCEVMTCMEVITCNLTDLQPFGVDDLSQTVNEFEINITAIASVAVLSKLWGSLESVEISSLVETAIIMDNQPRAIQVEGHCSDNFMVKNKLRFKHQLPILAIALGVSIGLLILIIIIVILAKTGFFTRKKQQKMEQIRVRAEYSTESVLETEREDMTDELVKPTNKYISFQSEDTFLQENT